MKANNFYEQQLKEKDEKIKSLKTKIENFSQKSREILEENNQLKSKIEKLPENLKAEM